MSSGTINLEQETRSLMKELNTFDKGGLLDLGHPLLNRIADSFVKAAGIGAIQAVSREAYLTVVEGAGVETTDIAGGKKRRLPEFGGDNYQKSLEAMVKRTGKESLQWGLVAGVYSGLTYGLKEARGQHHDWFTCTQKKEILFEMLMHAVVMSIWRFESTDASRRIEY